MKKIIVIVLALFAVSTAYSQARFGVKGGVNISTYTVKYDGKKVDDAFKAGVGFHVGGVAELSLGDMFAVQPELLFVNASSKFESNTGVTGGNVTGTTTINQIQLPVNAKLKFGVDDLKFIVTAGPYIGFGLSGKSKVGSESYNIYEGNDSSKRFDAGLGIGIGVEISKFTVNVGYQMGLANLSNIDKSALKLNTALFSVGYFF